uniref:Uncharacterized protein n=1 Tax=Arundo donax TaxID=35708 RepID=A0A0A8Z1J5_ARUDO
MSINSSVSGL